ncbi:MAG TPA: SRPBCC domain-containing protein [Bacteroidia bacterium]|nr:SRPBCC domain-containing protein [Bacteroidia bacterium]
MEHNWSSFKKRIPVKAARKKIYDAWITRAALEKWFLREAIFFNSTGTIRERDSTIEAGDSYEWRWFGHSDEVTERGKVITQDGNIFKFTFGKAGVVTVRINEENDVPILELLQENIPTDEESKVNFHLGCSTGWTFYLINLKSLLEGGIDLRNKDLKLANVVSS